MPNTIGARFEIASLTKAFTGVAIAQLAAAGRLELDDPVARYVPDPPAAWQDVTIDELLTHTSGLPANGLDDLPKGIAVPYTPEELLATFRDRPLAFAPGTEWRYTNTEYYLLAYVLRRVSGETYGEYLARHIFGPLGMIHSGFLPTTAVVDSLAEGYAPDSNSVRHRDYFDRSLEIGAGGVYTTAHDLLRWSLALDTDALVPQSYRERIFRADNPGHYGYGWFVSRDSLGVRDWHEGSDPGYAAFIVRRPAERLLVVVLSNLENAPAREIAGGLERVALGLW